MKRQHEDKPVGFGNLNQFLTDRFMPQQQSAADYTPEQGGCFIDTNRLHRPKQIEVYNPNDDAQKLYRAFKLFGADEAKIIDVLCKRTSLQRQEILLAYKAFYKKNFADVLKSKLKESSVERLLSASLLTPMELEARDLKKSITEFGKDNDSLIDILCTKTNSQMVDLKNTYKIMHKKDIEKDIGVDTEDNFKQFIVSLCTAPRSEKTADQAKAAKQSKELYDAGAKKQGADEIIKKIVSIESFEHLKLVCDEYYSLANKDIEQLIKSEMSGSIEKSILAIVAMAKNPSKYFAKRLGETIKDSGAHERALIRNIILQSEIDMEQLKKEYKFNYEKSLDLFIKEYCSGEFQRGLLCLVD